MTEKIKQMMGAMKLSQNPQAALNQLIQSNPQMQQVMQYVNASGKTPEQAFYALAEQKGINPQEIIDAVKSAF